MNYKYCLIVSQYYHSRHFFIVAVKEDFIEKARLFTTELMGYKRKDEPYYKEGYLGDLDPKYCGDGVELRSRYNINDAGDIYFINSNYANKCMGDSWEYRESSRRESSGYIKKDIQKAINEHHSYSKVCSIVEKYFEIA